MPLDTAWALARRWYRGRLSPAWRRPTPAEAEQLFHELGLAGDFWRLAHGPAAPDG